MRNGWTKILVGKDEEIERLTALAHERQEIIKEQAGEIIVLDRERAAAFQRWRDAIAKYPNGADGCCCLFDKDQNQICWCSIHAELRDEIAALKKKAQDLHGLAVSPDDPLITPVEKEILILRGRDYHS